MMGAILMLTKVSNMTRREWIFASGAAIEPSVVNTLNKSYPIARSLLVYTLGVPTGEVAKYIDWTLSDPGQKIVEQSGYVPLATDARKK